ncbi:MAG: hypothetical protein QOH71_3407 [Blastocatellia bacterium]|jgi:hypothetical protein|nr:hypothetical protein [Blastocatellia bacterium]
MSSIFSVIRKSLPMSIIIGTLAMAVVQPAKGQSNGQILANLPAGAQFSFVSNGRGTEEFLLVITNIGLRPDSNAYTIGISPAVIQFSGNYYAFKEIVPTRPNVSGSITIERRDTFVALRISFTVNPGSVSLPKGGRRITGEIQFEGALRLGMITGESTFMAGTFTIINPPVPSRSGPGYQWDGREGPFPFYAHRS